MKKMRKVLVILSDRLTPQKKPRYVEIECDEKGNVFKEHALRARPKVPQYDEVWENDEGRRSLDDCHRIKRKYGHALEKRADKKSAGRK